MDHASPTHYMGMEAIALAAAPEATFDADYPVLFAELTRLCRALGAGSRAEDVAQEAILYGRSHVRELRDPARLRPWLRTIAARAVTRLRPVDHRTDEGAEVFIPVDADLGIDAARAVATLPLRERQAVVLVYGLGFSNVEAAAMLGISAGTLGASLWKARQRLARELAGYSPEAR